MFYLKSTNKLVTSFEATSLEKENLGCADGNKMDQNKPLRPGFRSFAEKLMDRNSIKVFAFDENQSSKNWKTEMG